MVLFSDAELRIPLLCFCQLTFQSYWALQGPSYHLNPKHQAGDEMGLRLNVCIYGVWWDTNEKQ